MPASSTSGAAAIASRNEPLGRRVREKALPRQRRRRVLRTFRWAHSRVFGPVAIAGADTNQEAIFLVGQSRPAFAMQLFENLVHAPLLGGLAGDPALAAELGTPAPPSLERASRDRAGPWGRRSRGSCSPRKNRSRRRRRRNNRRPRACGPRFAPGSSIRTARPIRVEPVHAAPPPAGPARRSPARSRRHRAVHGATMLSRDGTTDALPGQARSIRPPSNGRAGIRLASISTQLR